MCLGRAVMVNEHVRVACSLRCFVWCPFLPFQRPWAEQTLTETDRQTERKRGEREREKGQVSFVKWFIMDSTTFLRTPQFSAIYKLKLRSESFIRMLECIENMIRILSVSFDMLIFCWLNLCHNVAWHPVRNFLKRQMAFWQDWEFDLKYNNDNKEN